jgi:hypothetical protein
MLLVYSVCLNLRQNADLHKKGQKLEFLPFFIKVSRHYQCLFDHDMVVRTPLCHLQFVLSDAVNISLFTGCKQILLFNFLEIDMKNVYNKAKNVFVRRYTRFRFGRIENVCQHWRSYPRQLDLFN